MKKIAILTAAVLLLFGAFAPISHAFLYQPNRSNGSYMQDQDRDRGRLNDRDYGQFSGQRYGHGSRFHEGIGNSSRPTLRGGEGAR